MGGEGSMVWWKEGALTLGLLVQVDLTLSCVTLKGSTKCPSSVVDNH